jgi:fructose-1,6-bisphosphatase I
VYSVNEGYAGKWDPKLRTYIDSLKDGTESWRARYIGSLVADFHRNLLKGGIFLYPGTIDKPEGKLRLLYEGFPMAFIAEAAGGLATDGRCSILDVMPQQHHQRTPLFIGNRKNVEELMQALNSTT